jgi:hypothetical protein
MEKALLVAAIRNRIFNDQQTDVKAALSAAHGVLDSISDPASRIGALTAMHVVLNTVANAIEALPEFLPAPPDEVRISPEDNPATGAAEPEPRHVMLMLDRASLDAIIDARIANWYEHEFDIQEEIEQGINDYDFENTVRDIVRSRISFSIDVD